MRYQDDFAESPVRAAENAKPKELESKIPEKDVPKEKH